MKDILNRVTELSEQLPIDKYNMDEVCANHSELYFQAALLFAECDGNRHRADAKVQEGKAVVGNCIREKRNEEGLKTSENMILELVDSDDEMIQLRKERAQANSDYAMAQALLNSFEHRRSMINNEVQLLVSETARTVGKAVAQNTKAKMDNYYDEKKKETPRRRKTSGKA